MPRINTSMEERLRLAQIAIGNALADPTLQTALAAYGYTADRLQQGNALREQAWALYQRQKGQYGELFGASDALEAAQQQAKSTYMHYIKVARLALEGDRGASQKLGLATQRKPQRAGWVAQARQFYTYALSDTAILGKLAEFGITQARLEAGRGQIEMVSEREVTRQHYQGTARDATRMRNETLAALDRWMKNFTMIARVAFEDRPQLLEKLGIKAHGKRAVTRTPGPVAGSEVAFDVEATTFAPDSNEPAPVRRNGRATIKS